ncbi:uncharacterized protein N0V89_008453 [Didymosphaeria variabile]|uniref:EthD domain-containing protein n=1 Tax=Didymosphaeria variabile TaxID=1932322 RepID=A0A9W9C8K4_9PLEO|nr:uncharacterized protein N0V89_008453 [Didymosphaeria variabile]KAJ4349834.1 hypothetical protein N0V89_008453 [Didymosphaeria variabile]
MTYVTILYLTRKPTLTPKQFRDYYESTHIPLIKSIFGSVAPLRHRRCYLARANSDSKDSNVSADAGYPPLVLRGTPEDFDYDCIAEVSWEDENDFNDFNKMYMQPGVMEKLAEDEERFLVREKLRAVAIGEVIESSPRNDY